MLWASYLSPKCRFQNIQRSWKPTNWVAHKKLLFSIHLLIHSLIDWLLDSVYWWIHWLISDIIHLDITKMEKTWKNLLQLPWHFCELLAPNGSSWTEMRFASSSSPSWSDTRIFRRKWNTQLPSPMQSRFSSLKCKHSNSQAEAADHEGAGVWKRGGIWNAKRMAT